MAERDTLKLTVNGKKYEFTVGVESEPGEQPSYDIYPWDRLVEALRGKMGLKGTKLSCDSGACTVIDTIPYSAAEEDA